MSTIDDSLAEIVDHGVTREEQVLSLCSDGSHVRLRNANLPRGVRINLLHELMRRGVIFSQPIPRDELGSIVEYRLNRNGETRLQELRTKRQAVSST